MHSVSDDFTLRLLTICLVFCFGAGSGMAIQKKMDSRDPGVARNQIKGFAGASGEIYELKGDLDSSAIPAKYVDESLQIESNKELISEENFAQEPQATGEGAVLGAGDLWYDTEDPVLTVESYTNFGESGLEPESAEASFFPEQIKNVGESFFDPELAEQSFVPTIIKDLGSPVYDAETALFDAMPDEVMTENDTTALDAETSFNVDGRI